MNHDLGKIQLCELQGDHLARRLDYVDTDFDVKLPAVNSAWAVSNQAELTWVVGLPLPELTNSSL